MVPSFEHTGGGSGSGKSSISDPLISIVVPIYKVEEKYLRTCIESLIGQTIKNIEIILVDDGSPDNCGLICDEYARSDSRVLVLHKENEGVCKARNMGIDAACGQYISFLDADDWIENGTYEFAVKRAIESGADLVSWNHYYDYEIKKEEIKRSPMPEDELRYSSKDIQTRLIYDYITPEYDIRFHGVSLGAVRGVWGKLYKLDIIKSNCIQFDSRLKIGEDACFNIEYAHKIKNALFVNKYFNHYRILETSANHGGRNDIEEVRINLLKKYRELFEKQDDVFWMCYKREVISTVVNCMTKYYCTKESTLGFKERVKGIKNLLECEDVACIGERKNTLKSSFFKPSERLLLRLICNKAAFSLYFMGNIIKFVKDR